MFGNRQISSSRDKDKVKAHNRLSKGKSGYKVIRVHDFFRKKDEDRNKKIALGVAGAGLLVGSGLLLKKKGVSNLLTKKTNIIKPSTPQQVTKAVDDVIIPTSVTPKTNLLTPTKKDFPKIEDPWETPVLTKIQKDKVNAKSMVPQSKDIPLLTGKKIPANRDNLLITDTRASKKVTNEVVRLIEMDKTYKSIDDLSMRASVKMDHYLKRPRKTSELGRPPKETSLKEVLDNPNIKKAKEKVTDRLSRAERKLLQKKARLAKKN
jgi:hypothetical protein